MSLNNLTKLILATGLVASCEIKRDIYLLPERPVTREVAEEHTNLNYNSAFSTLEDCLRKGCYEKNYELDQEGFKCACYTETERYDMYARRGITVYEHDVITVSFENITNLETIAGKGYIPYLNFYFTQGEWRGKKTRGSGMSLPCFSHGGLQGLVLNESELQMCSKALLYLAAKAQGKIKD